MITSKDVQWGKYKQYEGPYCHGKIKFVLSDNPSIEEKIIAAITATEGGTYDSVNAYDSCIMSLGLIQWCDKFHLMTRMLSYVANHGGSELITRPLANILTRCNAKFDKNIVGEWTFYQNGLECKTIDQLRNLYYAGATGLLGSWSAEQRDVAIQWVIGLANIWNDPIAQKLQVEYTASKIDIFTMQDAKKLLMTTYPEWVGWIAVTKFVFLSYAANNPTEANRLIKKAFAEQLKDVTAGTKDWAIALIKCLALESNIAIWPGRYDRLRPVVEKLTGLQLPIDQFALANYVIQKNDLKQATILPSVQHEEISSIEVETPIRNVDDSESVTSQDALAPIKQQNIFIKLLQIVLNLFKGNR